MNKSELENKINEFWEKDIWKCEAKNIHNERIKNTLLQIQKLISSVKPNQKIFLLTDGDFKIKSNTKNESLIEKLKKDNITYIKLHADSIPEYHSLIISNKKQKLFLPPET